MKRLLILIAALMTAALLTAGCSPLTYFHPTGGSSTVCYEDQPCWDCHTMGNRICGPGKG